MGQQWRRFTGAQGKAWEVNNDGLRLLSHAYCLMQLRQTNSSVSFKRIDIGLGRLLDVPYTSLDINWAAIKSELPHSVAVFYNNKNLKQQFVSNASVDFLASVRASITLDTDQMKATMRTMSQQNAAAFASVDQALETTMAITKAMRDACFTGVVVISGFLTGGAAWSALGGGAVLKGAASYQDTQNFGTATLTTVGTFAVAAIPLGGASLGVAKTVGQKTLLLVGSSATDGSFEAANAVVDGKSVSGAVKAGLARTGLDLAGGALDLKLDKVPLLLRVSVSSSSAIGSDLLVKSLNGETDRQTLQTTPLLSTGQNINFAAYTSEPMSDRAYILANVLRPVAS
jgi:hypothetical protein